MTNENPCVDANAKGKSAKDIPVKLFRQIHHMPLVWQGSKTFPFEEICKELCSKDGEWQEIEKPLRVLTNDRSKPDPNAFNEVVYFHDFARDFLYPHGESPPFRLFEKHAPGEICTSFYNNADTHHKFSIERLTLHVFRMKTAILTVETLHDTHKSPLTLAQVQTIIDHFRRSYTPFWRGEKPAMVPTSVCLSNGVAAQEQKQSDMLRFFEDNRHTCADAPLLEPWASWLAPLDLKNWRDPNDERVPVMSLILLEKTESSNRDTLNQIRESDWYRLAEADESGDMFAYNPSFLRKKQFFYDRFMPDTKMPDYLATRHIFGGAHYCAVSVDDVTADFNFPRNVLQTHFRRHYEKMALVTRFEFATLLAFSSRITKAIKELEKDTSSGTRKRFRKEILYIQEEFLEFTHRYHFTGISSQIQAAEMYRHWRASLDLDALYRDVKEEISSASQYAQAVQADVKAGDANSLAWVAILVGVLVSAPSLNEFALFQEINAWLTGKFAGFGWETAKPYIEFFVPGFSVAVVSAILLFCGKKWYHR